MNIFGLSLIVSFLAAWAAELHVESYLSGRISFIGSFFGIEVTKNPGIAFGWVIPGIWQPLLIVVALLFVIYLEVRSDKTLLNRIGYGFIIGAGLENMFDRLFDGLVTDFIQVGSFPIFNLADVFITAGVVLLFVDLWLSRHRTETDDEDRRRSEAGEIVKSPL